METGSTRVYVSPRSGGGWELRETRDGPVLERPMTKADAVARAAAVLERGPGGQIVVLSPDGSVQRTLVVAPAAPRPRWYVRPGVPRLVFPVLLGLQLLAHAADVRAGGFDLVLTLLLALLFSACLVLVLKSRALNHARRPSDLVE